MTAPSIALWLAVYLALSWGREAMESWLLARFQRRSGRGSEPDVRLGLSWRAQRSPGGQQPTRRLAAAAGIAAQTAAATAALLTGAMIPIAPAIQASRVELSAITK